MTYRTKSHCYLCNLSAIYRRAKKWAKIQTASSILTGHDGILRHVGSAY